MEPLLLREPGGKSRDQKALLKTGKNGQIGESGYAGRFCLPGLIIGTLTAKIPAIVSRTPQRLILRADGLPTSVMVMRMTAAAMTKNPEQRRRTSHIFCLFGTCNAQSKGKGIARTAASVKTLRTVET